MKPKKLIVTDIEQQLELITTNVNSVREQINNKSVSTILIFIYLQTIQVEFINK